MSHAFDHIMPVGSVGWVLPGDYYRWRDEFAKALDERFFHIGYLDWLVATHKAHCWSNERAAIVTESKQFPSGKWAVHGLLAAGEMEAILPLIEEAEQWGRDMGFEYALIDSREGWVRQMKPHGYSSFQTAIIKEL